MKAQSRPNTSTSGRLSMKIEMEVTFRLAPLHMCTYETTRTSILTSTYGPIVAPADVALRHFETTDALWALQFVTLVAGEMHCGSSPAVRLHTEKTHQHRKPAQWECTWGESTKTKIFPCWKINTYIFLDSSGVISQKCCIVGGGCSPFVCVTADHW